MHSQLQRKLTLFASFICLLVACLYSYDIFIRVAPSVMSTGLERDLNINAESLGFLSAAYFYSYIIFQIPAGIILDKYNIKWVLSVALGLCIIGNVLFSVSSHYDIAFLGRILMGIGSAFGFIGAAKIASIWLPLRFFSPFMALTTFIGTLGGIVADTLLNTLVHHLGWRSGNNVFTFVGIILFLFIFIFVKDKVRSDNQTINKHYPSLMAQIKTLFVIAKNYQFWAASIVGGVLFIPINVLASLWGVGFIQAKLGVSQSIAADINSTLFLGSAVGFVLVSAISAYTNRFRMMLIISSILLTFFSLLIIYIPMPTWLFTTLFILLGVSIGPQVLTFGIGKAVSPKGATATSVAGVNMMNNVIGSVLLPLFGWILITVSIHHLLGHVYALRTYYYAMSMLPILTIVCIPLCILLPKHTKG